MILRVIILSKRNNFPSPGGYRRQPACAWGEKKEGVFVEQKNLRKTAGGPLSFGLAAMLLMVVSGILQSGVSAAYMNAVFLSSGFDFTVSPASMAILTVIGLVIYPGIFLILLLVSVNRPRRGTAFCVVWGILSGLSFLLNVSSLFSANVGSRAQLTALANQLVPGGYYLYAGLSIAASACVLVSCILLFRRLHTLELPVSDDMAGQVNP